MQFLLKLIFKLFSKCTKISKQMRISYVIVLISYILSSIWWFYVNHYIISSKIFKLPLFVLQKLKNIVITKVLRQIEPTFNFYFHKCDSINFLFKKFGVAWYTYLKICKKTQIIKFNNQRMISKTFWHSEMRFSPKWTKLRLQSIKRKISQVEFGNFL